MKEKIIATLKSFPSIPGDFIDYLLRAVSQSGNVSDIHLIPVDLGMGEVQEIVVYTEQGIIKHRVFGFEPVEGWFHKEDYRHQKPDPYAQGALPG